MKTQYDKQAEKFLTESCIKMNVKFLRHAIHFQDDKDSRDIFRVSFNRDKRYGHPEWNNRNKVFSITFGQSLVESTGQGNNKPSAYSVLACITKNDPGTFENFCSDFGYDVDSRKAENTYKSIVKEWRKIEAFFTPLEIEQLAEIQ